MDLVRGLTPAQKASLKSFVFFPTLFFYLDWPNDPLRFSLATVPLSFGGQTYAPFGAAGSLTLPAESLGLASDTANLSIIGVDHDLDSKMNSPLRGRAVNIWFGLLTEAASGNLIGNPLPLFRGTVGGMRLRTSSTSGKDGSVVPMSKIELDLSTGPSPRARSSVSHTNEDQASKFPGDTAGRLVILSQARAQKLRWPQ